MCYISRVYVLVGHMGHVLLEIYIDYIIWAYSLQRALPPAIMDPRTRLPSGRPARHYRWLSGIPCCSYISMSLATTPGTLAVPLLMR